MSGWPGFRLRLRVPAEELIASIREVCVMPHDWGISPAGHIVKQPPSNPIRSYGDPWKWNARPRA